MQSRDRGQHPQTLPATRRGWLATPQAARTDLGSNARVSASAARGGEHATADFGLWLQRLVGGPFERAPEKADEDFLQRGPVAAHPSPRGVFVPTAQAHDERQTQ